jgi:hypothetical protein
MLKLFSVHCCTDVGSDLLTTRLKRKRNFSALADHFDEESDDEVSKKVKLTEIEVDENRENDAGTSKGNGSK